MNKLFFKYAPVSLCILLLSAALSGYRPGSDQWSLKKYREERTAKLKSSRPVIYNNDGDDVYVYHRKFPVKSAGAFSIDKFLSLRTTSLIGTDVSAISYCTSRGFGSVMHPSKVAEVIGKDANDHFPYKDEKQKLESKFYVSSALPEFLAQGTDPMKVMTEFAKKQNLEFFWSNRMNDTHDVSHEADAPHFLWTRYKAAHPEYLFGKMGEKLPHGRWSSADFGVAEVRKLCVDMFTEVCQNYDVDGIELDFCRHLELFKNVARGETASAKQLDELTEMVKQIREMTERVGMQKKSPILVSVRVPDSFEYSKAIGIDLERWMKQGLIDMVIGSDYFKLNTWDYFVDAGKKYGIQVYAGLSEPRVKNEHPLLVRRQTPVARAQASAAWKAGVNGLYLFNQFNPKEVYFSEIQNASKLKLKNKLYFVTNRNGVPEKYLKDGSKHAHMPLVTPQNKLSIKAGEAVDLPFEIGEEGSAPDVFLVLYSEQENLSALQTSFNKENLKLKKTAQNLFVFPVPAKALKGGMNTLTLNYPKDGNKGDAVLQDAALLVVYDYKDPFTRNLARLCWQK